jgi:hypothetical protein
MENTSRSFITDLAYEEMPTLHRNLQTVDAESSGKSFIEANTIGMHLDEIKNMHVIPVFAKDNEPTISHVDFIDTTRSVVADYFAGEHILKPSIRVSHPIKGRIPDAKHKSASELYDHERTIYYERMAFAIEIPTLSDDIGGNRVSLTIGGVKSYSQDNLYLKKGADEHFKIFVGYQNKVCTNLCVWSDGFVGDLKVNSIDTLGNAIRDMIEGYSGHHHLNQMKQLTNYGLTENQFAHLIGKCRMYQYLPSKQKDLISPLLFGDQQIGAVCRDYYQDDSFCRNQDGEINLWRLYNLFTGANKSSYIDQFLNRSVNSFDLVDHIKRGLEGKVKSWFLN